MIFLSCLDKKSSTFAFTQRKKKINHQEKCNSSLASQGFCRIPTQLEHLFIYLPDLVRRMISPLSSDSGRGADYSGPAVTSCRSPTEVTRPAGDKQQHFKHLPVSVFVYYFTSVIKLQKQMNWMTFAACFHVFCILLFFFSSL